MSEIAPTRDVVQLLRIIAEAMELQERRITAVEQWIVGTDRRNGVGEPFRPGMRLEDLTAEAEQRGAAS